MSCTDAHSRTEWYSWPPVNRFGVGRPRALGDVTGLPRLLDAIRATGFSEAEMEQIAWANWRRVLEACWSG